MVSDGVISLYGTKKSCGKKHVSEPEELTTAAGWRAINIFTGSRMKNCDATNRMYRVRSLKVAVQKSKGL
jgi:hypothetical protein